MDLEQVIQWIRQLDVESLLHLKTEVEFSITEAKERRRDRRLEEAVTYLSSCCDGAHSQDGAGFNACDTGFGKWLASRIDSKEPILKTHAKAALKMLQKYQKQLERHKLSLPQWEAIAHQYPETINPTTSTNEKDTTPERRVQLIGDSIVVYAPYDPTGSFQKAAKRIEGYDFKRQFDNTWWFPRTQIEAVTTTFPQGEYHYDPNLEGAIALHQAELAEEAARLESEALEKSHTILNLLSAAELDKPLPNGWHLRDYQKRGVEWLLTRQHQGVYRGGILADQMGLGKTLTALVAAKAMQRQHECPIFVVAPVSLLDNWRREAHRVEVQIECFSWAKVPPPLDTQPYVLIGDESHFMQNLDSQRTQKLLTLAQHKNCLAAWLLTGTPIKNGRPINLYPLLLAVDHPLAADKWGYQRHYCNGHQKSVGKRTVWDVTGAAHLDELSQKTEDIILRRTKQQCLTELPAKTRILKPAELEPKHQKQYNAEIGKLIQDYRDRAKRGEVDPDAEALVTLNILRRVGSRYKVESAIALTEELLEQGQQVVLFTEFVESATQLHARLGGELLTGDTKPEERQSLVDRFQSGESKIFIGTIKAGGVGLTLTAASYVILVDRPWTPGDVEQAEDRCHRLGQQNSVIATWLQLGEIDTAIDSLLESKQNRIELILKGKRKTLRGLDSPKKLAAELLALL